MKNLAAFALLSLLSISKVSAQAPAYASVGASIVTPVTISEMIAQKSPVTRPAAFSGAEIAIIGKWSSATSVPGAAYPEKASTCCYTISGPMNYTFSVTLHNHITTANPEEDDIALSTGVASETGTLANGTQTFQVASLLGRRSPMAVVVNYN